MLGWSWGLGEGDSGETLCTQIAIIESVLYKNPLTFIDYASYAS